MLNLQAASLAVSQHLTAELRRSAPESVALDAAAGEEDDAEGAETGATGPAETPLQPADPNAAAAYQPPPALPHNAGARLQKMKKLKPALPPPQPMVAQMIEMGFTRSKVEFAIKALGKVQSSTSLFASFCVVRIVLGVYLGTHAWC